MTDLPPVRLIATDLDGTLLRPDKTVGRATRTALRGAADAGLFVTAATGRQPGTIPVDLLDCGVRYLVGANGAIGVDQCTDEILFERDLSAEAVAALSAFVHESLPDGRISVARDHGRRYLVEPGYKELVYSWETVPLSYLFEADPAEVADGPTIKLTVRHPSLSADELQALVDAQHIPGCHTTTSGAPFLEVSGAGVNKATGLELLCAHLGVDAAAVMAFGDAANDLEMLSWVGRGVAMGNASDEVKAIASRVTAANTEDGVGKAVEALLAERRQRWNRPATLS